MKIFPKLLNTINHLPTGELTKERINTLKLLVTFIQPKQNMLERVNLNFICTHNSRRSQFAQIWAQTAAYYYGIEVNCYSGGVEETAFNERAIASLRRAGFQISAKGYGNPKYTVSYTNDAAPLLMFSKLYDDAGNPKANFAAVMTCSHADENCPYIAGTEKRIPLLYDDPKEFDGTPEEVRKYDERSKQIAAELFYVFAQIIK